ncbi:hypothetical protein [Alienimonas californiensis]|uniref:Uncharacterized protein n=1 Tax=Alienimonas californiensis TaxID=2527989 RepID=A0A517P7Q2_9PLAN|nr:hypothetical protein [Alienimonas californiensis]QDT15407.1 hypothetical protein CA12_14920 [Alienimonas californiensis]
MNALAELDSLTALFPEPPAAPGGTPLGPLLAAAEHVPRSAVPEPYRTLLDHHTHMTVTMERFHGGPVAVRVLDEKWDAGKYCRKITLVREPERPGEQERVVQFGFVRFDLSYLDPEPREEILGGEIPLGRVLIEHDVLREVDLGALLKLTAGPGLARHLGINEGDTAWGRLATIFTNGKPALDLLEVAAPV